MSSSKAGFKSRSLYPTKRPQGVNGYVEARRHFDFVSVGAQDASRADPSFLVRCARAAREARVDRLRLADTVGIWSPSQTHAAVASLRANVPGLPLGFHGHNDLGMATANTLAAMEAGVQSVDVTVNGLGERAGNAPLEEVVMAARSCLRRSLGVDPRTLVALSRLVGAASGRPVPPSKAVVGHQVFSHESGIHVRAILQEEDAYQPFPPTQVGANSRVVLGKHSGTAAVRHVLAARGFTVTPEEAVELLAAIRARAACKGSPADSARAGHGRPSVSGDGGGVPENVPHSQSISDEVYDATALSSARLL